MKLTLEGRLGKLDYRFDKQPHIRVKPNGCQGCDLKACIVACPAGCFKLEGEKLVFKYNDCIECGSCKMLCPRDVIEWNYPRGTFGVAFRYG